MESTGSVNSRVAGCWRDVSFSPPAASTRQVRDSTRRPLGLRYPAATSCGPAGQARPVRLDGHRRLAQTDAMRAQAVLESSAQQPVTATMLRKFAATARQRVRIEGGGYRRDHLRALAQKVEVADREVRIMGSKSDLLRTLAAISGAKSATGGVRSSVLDWRCAQSDTNPSPCYWPKTG